MLNLIVNIVMQNKYYASLEKVRELLKLDKNKMCKCGNLKQCEDAVLEILSREDANRNPLVL